MKTLSVLLCALFVESIVFGLTGCGDDDSKAPDKDAAVDSGSGSGGNSGGSGGKGGKDAGKPGTDAGSDAGNSPASKPVTFKVPSNGGTAKVTLASGNELAFTFPKSAAGKMITLTPTTAKSIGWPESTFSDVIRMEPDGLKFSEPVIVQPSSKDIMLATFADKNKRSAGEMLELTQKAEGLALHHFSVLGIVAPDFSCGNHSGWQSNPDSQRCANVASATTFMSFSCDASPLCWNITAACCAKPGSTSCHLGDPMLTMTFSYQYDASGSFPWCGPVPGQDAGMDASSEDDAGPQGSGGTQGGSGGTQGGSGGTQGGSGGTQGGSGGTQGGSGGTQGGSGGTQGGSGGQDGSGGTQGGTGGVQGGSGGTQGGTGGTQGGSGGVQGGTGGTQGGTGGTQGGTGGIGSADAGTGVTCDQAGSWTPAGNVPMAEQLFGVWGSNDMDVWVVGNATGAGALIGHYNGAGWTSEQPPALTAQGQAFYAVWGADATHVFAVGTGGAIYSNATGSWAAVTSPTSQTLYAVWGVDMNNYWVVGANGAAFQWSGGAWHDYTIIGDTTDTIGTLRGVWGTGPSDVWVINNTGGTSATTYAVHHFYSGAWHTEAGTNGGNYQQAIWGTSNSDIWAIGYTKGTSAYYNGSGWTASNAPAAGGAGYLNAVWGRATDSVWAVGDVGKIDYWDGGQWTACALATQLGLNGVYGTTTKVWAAGNNGLVLRKD